MTVPTPIPISSLPSTSLLTGTEQFPVVQAGTTKSALVNLVVRQAVYATGYVNVKDYGAMGDYSFGTHSGTDDTAAIQAAITNNPSKTLIFPAGNYLITSTLTIASDVSLVGANSMNTYLVPKFATGDVISYSANGKAISDVQVSGLNLYCGETARTSGYCLSFNTDSTGSFYTLMVNNLVLTCNGGGGIHVNGAGYFHTLRDIEMSTVGANSQGLKINGHYASHHSVGDLTITNVAVRSATAGTTTAGIMIDSYAEGIYCTNCTCESTGLNYDLYVTNSAAATPPPQNLFFTTCIFDNPGTACVLVEKGWNLQLIGCWITSSMGYGAHIQQSYNVRISDCTIASNFYSGLYFENDSSGWLVNGNTISSNNCALTTYSGIDVEADSGIFSITNNMFSTGSGAYGQVYCVKIPTGISDNYIIANNNCKLGYSSSAISDGGSGIVKSVTGNIG